MFITVCARLDAYTDKCTNTCTYAHTHNTHRYICTYNHIYTQMCTHRCAHTNVHARMSRTYTYIYTNTLNIYIYIIKVYGIHKLIHTYPVRSRTARAVSFQNPRHSGHTVFFPIRNVCCLSLQHSSNGQSYQGALWAHPVGHGSLCNQNIPVKKLKRREEEEEEEEE